MKTSTQLQNSLQPSYYKNKPTPSASKPPLDRIESLRHSPSSEPEMPLLTPSHAGQLSCQPTSAAKINSTSRLDILTAHPFNHTHANRTQNHDANHHAHPLAEPHLRHRVTTSRSPTKQTDSPFHYASPPAPSIISAVSSFRRGKEQG